MRDAYEFTNLTKSSETLNQVDKNMIPFKKYKKIPHEDESK